MTISETLLQIRHYKDVGYKPIIDFGSWRVAILRYIDELLPENICRMQRHDETDEVFVLLEGRCILFIGVGDEQIEKIQCQEMEPSKLYNVKRYCWHTHTLSKDATVLIIENRDTDEFNSPEIDLNPEQMKKLVKLTNKIWE
jgi:hypothetical protein